MSKFPVANKSFGQHFLHSKNVIEKITSLPHELIDTIVEVGPGPAVLTPRLSDYKKKLFVIEMDERFVPLLEQIVDQNNIFREDALSFNWKSFLEAQGCQKIWLVSNLPYNISVPLSLSFLRIPEIDSMTLMYQKEVAQKILPNDPRNSMGSLRVLMQTQFDIQHVVYAPPGAFSPPPKVDSQVLSFRRKKNPDISLDNIDIFEKTLRLIFSQKRKQLGGILKKEWGEQKTRLLFEAVSIPLDIRAEALSYEQVLKLFELSTRS